ncbi:MAG: glycosyltransferase [Oscillospiraceae bacterium]|nr:glycosyltransferase [Oscillospiraceae bacterium]
MNLLYLISYAGRAGTEKYVYDLMELFSARGHTCHLAFQEGGELSEKAERAGYPVLRLDLRPVRTLSAARKLAAYCRDHQITAIHAQYPRENVIAVLSRLWRRETRVVFTGHLSIRQGAAWRLVNRLITPRDAAVVALYDPGAALLRDNGVCPDRIRVIPNGVRPRPLPEKLNAIRQEYGLAGDTFIFLTFARYAPEKGLFFLLNAAARLRELTDRPFAVVIAGDGEEYGMISRRIRELGLETQVIQAGYRTDTETLLRSADAYVSSALFNEAMSFSILEAMSCALPLAVTDVGAGRELCRGCGTACAPGDTEAMAENLLSLLVDPERSAALGREAYRRVTTEYDLDRSADALAALYEE